MKFLTFDFLSVTISIPIINPFPLTSPTISYFAFNLFNSLSTIFPFIIIHFFFNFIALIIIIMKIIIRFLNIILITHLYIIYLIEKKLVPINYLFIINFHFLSL